MESEERRALIAAHAKRLHALKVQQAKMGSHTPAYISLEIDELKEILRGLGYEGDPEQDTFVDQVVINLIRQDFTHTENETFEDVKFIHVGRSKQWDFIFREEYYFLITELDQVDRQTFASLQMKCISYAKSRPGSAVKYFVFIIISKDPDAITKEHLRKTSIRIPQFDGALTFFMVYDLDTKDMYHPSLKDIPHRKFREIIGDIIPLIYNSV